MINSLLSFFIGCLSSHQVGKIFSLIHLPLITGFLFCGILIGPHGLHILKTTDLSLLDFVDKIALAFIALVSGSELYLKEYRSRLRSIASVTSMIILFVLLFAISSLVLLSDYLPFTSDLSFAHKLAIAFLAGSILIARSPSSAIAVIKETRSKGPFTQTSLGVTIIMDVIVIILFSLSSNFALAVFSTHSANLSFLVYLALDLLLSGLMGFVLFKVICAILKRSGSETLEFILVLGCGSLVFWFSEWVKLYTKVNLAHEIVLEPLLICMFAGVLITNKSPFRQEFFNLLHPRWLPIYVAFFTITGASLHLDVLKEVWPIALALFAVRLGGIMLGAFLGGTIAGEPFSQNKVAWMCYITQAGVGLGLSKAVAGSFPGWGGEFATLMVSVIVINEVVGPPIFRFALVLVGEAHPKASKSDHHLIHRALIFGLDAQAVALAKQLQIHGWQVDMITPDGSQTEPAPPRALQNVRKLNSLDQDVLGELDIQNYGAVVTMLSDQESYQICEYIYEHHGTVNMIVHLNEHSNMEKFRELECFVVAKATAIISLLDHYVRSPSAVSLLLDEEDDHDIIDVELTNTSYHGMTLSEIMLPEDVLILSVMRKGQLLHAHGYLKLRKGDLITVLGTHESIEEIAIHL